MNASVGSRVSISLRCDLPREKVMFPIQGYMRSRIPCPSVRQESRLRDKHQVGEGGVVALKAGVAPRARAAVRRVLERLRRAGFAVGLLRLSWVLLFPYRGKYTPVFCRPCQVSLTSLLRLLSIGTPLSLSRCQTFVIFF